MSTFVTQTLALVLVVWASLTGSGHATSRARSQTEEADCEMAARTAAQARIWVLLSTLAQNAKYRALCRPSTERPEKKNVPGEIDKAGKIGYNSPRGGEVSMVKPTHASGWPMPRRSETREAPASTGKCACSYLVLSSCLHSRGGA